MSNEQRIEELNEKRKQIESVSCSFCTAKWLQTTLYLQNGYNHSCHHPAPHKIPLEEVLADPSSLHNSKFKKEQRKKMLNGDRPSECDYCWKIEDLGKGYFSDRHYKTADVWAWDRFEEIAQSNPEDNVYPSYLEVSFSNNCNFACAYCSPDISSKWMEDVKQYGPYPTTHGNHNLEFMRKIGKIPYKHSDDNPYVTAFWKWFPNALPHLKILRVTGGEPTMSKDVWKLIDYIIENPNPNLGFAINTNLCVTPSLIDKLILKVNEMKKVGIKVDVYTSIESTDSQAEYVRDGLNYKTWLSNLNMLLDKTTINVAIMTTINILSLPTFCNFISMLMQLRVKYNKNFENNRIPLSVNIMRWPPHLQCTLLSRNDRLRYADNIEALCKQWLKYHSVDKYARLYLEEWDQIKRFCDYLRTTQSATEHRVDFVKYIKAYDNRRKKDFALTFPRYAHLLEDWYAS